jgi:hypothetical protein
MAEVVISTERARGCGYRKPAKDGVGIYLVGDGLGEPCGLLPYPLDICPCCGGGIKTTRGWTWVTPQLLFKGDVLSKLAGVERECDRARAVRAGRKLRVAGSEVTAGCVRCPIGNPPAGLHGTLWVGEKFYATTDDFTRESGRQGVSRKIKAVPKGFKLSETWVLLAHRKAIRNPATGEREFPGIFSMFLPRGVDLVIADENAVPEKAERLAEKIGDGARIVKVVRDVDAQLDLAKPDAAQPEVH